MDKTTTAIIVDYDHFLSSTWDREFIAKRGEFASVVLFNANPEGLADGDHYSWNVVITNNGNLPKEQFLIAALSALSAHSNVYPAIALDDQKYEEIYMEAGVLLLLDTKDKEYEQLR